MSAIFAALVFRAERLSCLMGNVITELNKVSPLIKVTGAGLISLAALTLLLVLSVAAEHIFPPVRRFEGHRDRARQIMYCRPPVSVFFVQL